MKYLLLGVLAVSSIEAATLKTCKTTLSMPDSPSVASVFEIFEISGGVKAKVTQTVDGQKTSYEDSASIAGYPVRSGLNASVGPEGLNPAELLVVHAMMLESDPELGGKISSGVRLSKVRAATVYTIGEATNMGSTAIVEARDATGKALGSYLGGFLVSPCK